MCEYAYYIVVHSSAAALECTISRAEKQNHKNLQSNNEIKNEIPDVLGESHNSES